MADKELKIEKSVPVQQNHDRQNQNQNPIVSLLNNFHISFPQFNKQHNNKESSSSSSVVAAKEVASESESKTSNSKSDSVRIPDAGAKDFPSLKLETEDSQEPTGPSNMWQVYALGGFMIGRWLWARWNERKADKAQSGDDEQPSADN